MKTIKEIAEISGVSVRTLRYYDEIDLLKPAQFSEAGYRLYDEKALERLMAIMSYKELDMPLEAIKQILNDPEYDWQHALQLQKKLLEQKIRRFEGIIQLIDDTLKGIKPLNFEAFTKADVKSIFEHSLTLQSAASLEAILAKFGSYDAYREWFENYLMDEKTSSHFIKMYGSKNKAIQASLKTDGSLEGQDQIDGIYKQFAEAMVSKNHEQSNHAVEALGECYKTMFKLDNARSLLLKLASSYQACQDDEVSKATAKQYGNGITRYISKCIREYYGIDTN
ncbi:MerR family transcriptional regulator [Dielma fastidiosa]|uniref:MerR family transcriptional regulator n=1 Tax=Dielma fastidiosa TaxID=1034346 RepID=UPI003561C3AB